MAKPANDKPPRRGIPPRVDWNGKVVTMSTIHDGVASESLAGDFLCAAGSNDEASFERLKQHLRKHDVIPDFAGRNGITPLMSACSVGNFRGVDALAAHPLVNLARADNDGWTALHYAAHCGGPRCVRALLAHRAPFDAKTTAGETAFDLAPDDATRQAFLENRDFMRYLQRARPDHPALHPAPPPAPVAAAPAAAKAPEADPLKDAFFRAVTNVGLQWRDDPGLNVRRALVDKLAAMNEADIAQAWKTVRAANTEFPWEAVFIVAANRGNTSVMRKLHDEILFDERTLNQALSAAVAGGDQQDAAHHLLAWGANPSAPYEINGQLEAPSIFEGAFNNGRTRAFEEMMLWRGTSVSDREARNFVPFDKFWTGRASANPDFALLLREKAREYRKLRGKKLEAALNEAVENADLAGVMTGYLEAYRDRFLRGNAEVSPQTGGGAIAVALTHGRFEFARLLIADGYKLSNAPAHLLQRLATKGSKEALLFAKQHNEGTLKVPHVRDVGLKKRSEIRILMSMPYRPHYGMF